MKLFNDVKNYIGENNFRIIIYKDKIDIINYKKIEEITDNKIIIKNDKNIIITGKNLKLYRLLNKEVLLIGNILNIKFDE